MTLGTRPKSVEEAKAALLAEARRADGALRLRVRPWVNPYAAFGVGVVLGFFPSARRTLATLLRRTIL